MNNNTMTILILAALAIAAYIAFKRDNPVPGGVTPGGGDVTPGGGGGDVTPGTKNPRVSISDDVINQGADLTFEASGFAIYEDVKVYVVETGGYFYAQMDGYGTMRYSFNVGDPPGIYTLKVDNTNGTSATATFTVE